MHLIPQYHITPPPPPHTNALSNYELLHCNGIRNRMMHTKMPVRRMLTCLTVTSMFECVACSRLVVGDVEDGAAAAVPAEFPSSMEALLLRSEA